MSPYAKIDTTYEVLRTVNQLVLHETKPHEFSQKVCEILHEKMGYSIVLLFLFDATQSRINYCAHVGCNKICVNISDTFSRSEFPPCVSKALHSSDSILIEKPPQPCPYCPLFSGQKENTCITHIIETEKRVYGVLAISLPAEAAKQDQVQKNIDTISDELALSLEKLATHNALDESQRKYKQIFEKSRDGYVMVNESGHIIEANPSFCRMLGYTREELLGFKDFYSITPEKWHRWERDKIWNKLLKEGYSGIYEKEYIHKDGHIFPVELEAYTVHNKDTGKPDYFWGVARDITQRRKTINELRKSEDFLRETGVIARVGGWEIDTKTDEIHWTYATQLIHGVAEDYIPKLKDIKKFYPEDYDVLYTAMDNARLHGQPFDIELRLCTMDDTRLWIRCIGKAEIKNGMCTRVHGILQDITQIKEHQKELQKSKDTAEEYLNVASEIILTLDREGTITLLNDSGHDLLGYKRGTLIGKNWFETCLHPDDREEVFKVFTSLMNNSPENLENIRNRVYTKNGNERIIIWHNIIRYDEEGKAMGTLSSGLDITEAARAEEERRRLEKAIEQSNEMIIMTDTELHIQYANPACKILTGYSPEELHGKPLGFLMSSVQNEVEYSDITDILHSGAAWQGHVVNIRKDSALYTVDANISPVKDAEGTIVNYVSVQRDISHEIALEKHTRHIQKMESVGRLAGGIAHDLNNLLTPIMGYSSMLLNTAEKNGTSYTYVEGIIRASERARDLVQQLLTFSRKQMMSYSPLNVNTLLKNFQKLLQHTLRDNIKISVILYDKMPLINADAGQLEQVILNLAINAQDAMPEGGTLTIETGVVELDEKYVSTHNGMSPGSHVVIKVSDTGSGMDEGVCEQVFEPFFTTKEKGEGTGLGLSTSYGIISSHRGTINVYSEIGLGSTFSVYLPITNRAPQRKEVDPFILMYTHGDENILLVEDNMSVREMTIALLKEQGYTVYTAQNGKEALAFMDSHNDVIDLLITDIIMPEIDGPELAAHLHDKYPDLKVIYMSGYSENVVIDGTGTITRDNFLQKPFTSYFLASKVRHVLDGPENTSDNKPK